MDSIVIDTDVLSYLFKRDTRGDRYQPHLDGKLGVLSFMTIAELDFWANRATGERSDGMNSQRSYSLTR